jgi:hypothetical protein
MFDGMSILVIENDSPTVLDLSQGIEEAGGHVIGPARTVAEASVLVESHVLGAAVLDVNSANGDLMSLALLLAERRIPVVIYSGDGVPTGLNADQPHISVVPKSAPLSHVMEKLGTMKLKSEGEVESQLNGSRDASAIPISITFSTANILVGRSRRVGKLALADGNLAAVLVPVSGDEVGGNSSGGWYMEAVFGTCGGPGSIPPGVFATLDGAAAWLEERLGWRTRHYNS